MKRWLAIGIPALVAIALAITIAVVGLRGGDDGALGEAAKGDDNATSSGPEPTEQALDPDDAAYDVAESEPREDSLYGEMGDPGVDGLHYDLDLTWDPEEKVLDGIATLTFRAAEDAEEFQLDLGEPLEVEAVTLDGKDVDHDHYGKDLVIDAKVEKDERYRLEVTYSGTPEPVEAPTTRVDIENLGWTITDGGEVWTMQEPFGAFTWYPVNDQPADKALYDFTIRAPEGWTGVANGTLESTTEDDGQTVTRWHLDDPAASYLTTIAIGDFVMSDNRSESGVPISYWVPPDFQTAAEKLSYAAEAVDWLEEKLGPYPYDSLGFVVVDSQSGMETQTMITLGGTDYALSKAVVVHEITHQWYGDVVTPTDWRDMWMNEGMTMYLQGVWEAEDSNRSVDDVMDEWALSDQSIRDQAGPPGDFDEDKFGEGNVYYSPALMWHELRKKLGDDAFWDMVKTWPTVHANGNATREEYLAWVEKETGEELTEFFDDWLLGEKTPDRE